MTPLPNPAKERGVLLFSGGFDSTLTALLLADEGIELYALVIDYPGRPEGERLACKQLLRLLPFAAVATIGLASLRPLDRPEYRGTPLEGWVPYRNLLIWAIAAHHACVTSARFVAAGHDDDDLKKYSDATPRFFDILQDILAYSGGPLPPVEVRLPLHSLTEDELVNRARRALRLLESSWSCWRNEKTQCNRCTACKERFAFLAKIRELPAIKLTRQP